MTQATAPGVEVELEEVTLQLKPQERRRSSIALTLPGGMDQQNLAASVNIGADEVEFEAHGVKINHQGLFIEGTNVSEVHQDAMSMLCELGRGACSVVKKAQHVETRELYAIKIFSVFDREKRGQLLKEVETLWGMECPSLINFVGGYLKNGSIHVVLEYMDRGSLADLIHDWSGLEYGENLMAAIVFQILWGLGYLHYENHVHRDVKPQNVLLNSKGEVKISDFGIARELEGEMDLAQTMVGTIRYMSPERLAGAGYGVAADVWSLGVVLLEMAARRLPFDTTVSQIELHDKLQDDLVLDDLMKLVPGHSAHFEEVLRGCLQTRPEDRLSPEQLLQLEWFRQFRLPAEENDAEKTEPVPGPVAIPVPVPVVPAPVPAPAPVTVPAAVDEVVVAAAAAVSEEESMEAAAVTVAVEEPLEVSMEESPGAEDEEGAGGAGSEGSEGDSEGEGDVDEQHDLDRAAQVVREYILKGVECGILSAERPRMSMFPGLNGTNGGLRDSTGSGMLRTMYSDGGLSDSDDSKAIFGTLRDEDFGGFAGFEKEMSVPFDGHNLGIN